jgi:hypothetical protein
MKTFQLDLYQSHVARSHTESFTVEAKDEADAQAQADKIAKEKGLEKDFDFEVNEIVPPEDTMATSEEAAALELNPPATEAATTEQPNDGSEVPPRASSSSS